ERAELMKRIPTLEIALSNASPAEVSLVIDGKPIPAAAIGVPRPMDPGPHHVVGKRDADEAAQEITLIESTPAKVTLVFPRAASPSPPRPGVGPGAPLAPASATLRGPLAPHEDSSGSAQRTVGFIALGVGGAGLVLGVVTYALALGEKSDLDSK